MKRLYAMALYATRPEAAADTGESLEHEASLRVAMTVAASDDEAREKGMTQLHEWCPPILGWINHHVTLNIVPKESLRSFLDTVSDDPPDEGGVDAIEWPDLIN
ncbi:MAG: hypothetical protein WKF84_14330 [Pyrinomonadaceae bacterium]